MALHPKLLNEGEHVIVATRTHVKALLLPAIVLLVTCGLAGFLTSRVGGHQAGLWRVVIWVVALLVLAVLVVWPFLKWFTTTYAFTNRRLITRTGVLARRGHDIPVHRISDVAFDRGVIDRLLGCGTLIISDASEAGRVELHDIPHVEQVQLKIQDELFRSHGRMESDDGT